MTRTKFDFKKDLPSKEESNYSQWNSGRCHEAHQLALLGYKDVDIAKVMGINVNTLDLWKRKHPEFKEALKDGKDSADSKAAEGLHLRAVGFWIEWDEEEIFKGEVLTVHKKKYFPPDPWAASRWLSLRQRGLWTEIQKIETTQTNINIMKIDLSAFSTKDLEVINKLQLLQLTEHAGSN